MEFYSYSLLIFTVHDESQKYEIQYSFSTVRFLISSFSYAYHTRSCKEGNSYNVILLGGLQN